MPVDSFVFKCITETIDGLRDGLSCFSGPSRAAVVYAIHRDAPIYVCDFQNLLQGHEPKFKELYLDSVEWRQNSRLPGGRRTFGHLIPEKNLELAGLISYGGRSSSVFYQMWFSDHHPDMCSIGPTERWLEHAAWRFSHDVANEEELYTGISGSFLREYATHAVRDYIIDEMNVILGWDTRLRVYPILETVLGISSTPEEGAWPQGELVFVEPAELFAMKFDARFPRREQPLIGNFKHVRKLLLAVEGSTRKLVSDGNSIVGVVSGCLPAFYISADFRRRHGFLKVNDSPVCSFSDGGFKSTTHRAKLVQVEEVLLESDIGADQSSQLFKTVSSIVHGAEHEKYGCTIVLDLNDSPVKISGHNLEKPLDLLQPELLELAKSFAKVDGALHIGADCRLIGFACLLDGRTVAGEDRARGARYNSAIRFTAANENLLVVVVSSDRPVSVIQGGIEISAQCQYNPAASCYMIPRPMEEWIG